MGFESLEQIHGCTTEDDSLRDPQQQELAAVERGLMKDLSPVNKLPSTLSSASSLSSSSSSEDLCVVASDVIAAAPETATAADSSLDEVDAFLKAALNSRNRITILRLEHEIEKFAKNSRLTQLLLKHMPSSYERLAAHRVAQHYHLQSMVVDCNAPTGSRILLMKTTESRIPKIRLVDIPLDASAQEKTTNIPLEKVAIKQRATGSGNGYGNGNSGDSGRLTPVKTVEERKEEYNKARARIFNNSDLANRGEKENSVCDSSNAQAESISQSLQELTIRGGPSFNSESKDRVDEDIALKASNRVAIFRDREKDMKDPDYDRSYDRYSQRINTGLGINDRPFVMHRVCYPDMNVPGFSRLDGSGYPQVRIDPAAYPIPLHIRGPWTGSAVPASLGHPTFYGNFPQGQASYNCGPDFYFPAQRFPHTGHYNYIDRCQLPSQPGLQCKSSFGEVMHQR